MRSERSRLAEDVQRFGLLSAAAVVDRYRHLVDEAIEGAELDEAIPGGLERVDPSWLVDRASRLAGGYLRFLETAAAAIGSRSERPAVERVALQTTHGGDLAEGALWLHNPTEVPTRVVTATATPLLSVAGSTIPAESVRFDPQKAGPVPGGGTVQIRVTVAVPTDAAPGRYLGLVHLSASAEDPVALDLEVAG